MEEIFRIFLSILSLLLCSENTVTGIAQSWNDIADFIEFFVLGCQIDVNIRMLCLYGINAFLKKLAAKPTVGQMLRAKAEVQHLTVTDKRDSADEAYTYQWALDTAAVASVLLKE